MENRTDEDKAESSKKEDDFTGKTNINKDKRQDDKQDGPTNDVKMQRNDATDVKTVTVEQLSKVLNRDVLDALIAAVANKEVPRNADPLLGKIEVGSAPFSNVAGPKPEDRDNAVVAGNKEPFDIKSPDTTTEMAGKLATMVVDPMTTKTQIDAVDKMRAAMSSGMAKDMPTREMQVDIVRGVSQDSIDAQNNLLLAVSRTIPNMTTEIKRQTREINKIEIGETNLKIITSNLGRESVVIESLPEIKILNAADMSVQLAMAASQLVRKYKLDNPIVMYAQGNYITQPFEPGTKFTKDGLAFGEIVTALNAQRNFNGEPQLTPEEIMALMRSAVVIDDRNGRSVTRCYDGRIKNSIIERSVAVWGRNIIRLSDYLPILRAEIPVNYRIKEYTGLEMHRGYVYYQRRSGSLSVLVNLLQRECSEYFLPLLARELAIVKSEIVTTGSIQQMLSADNNLSINRSSYANTLLASLDLSQNERVRTFIILASIFPAFKIDIEYGVIPNVVDCIAATLYLLFINESNITDSSYTASLLTIASFILNRAVDSLPWNEPAQLANLLHLANWPFTGRNRAVQFRVRHSPIMSDGQPGLYSGVFNCDANRHHVLNDLSSIISRASNNRWRVGNNNQLGMLISTTLASALTLVMKSVSSYNDVVSRIRGGIPNSLANGLNYDRGGYKLSSVQLVSFMLSLSPLSLNPSLYENIDTMAWENLKKYEDLANDLDRTLIMVRSIARNHRPAEVPIMAYVAGMARVIDECWSDSSKNNFISKTLEAIFASAQLSGKEGYKYLLHEMMNRQQHDVINEPLAEITDNVIEVLRENLGAFGITYEILIYPHDANIVRDARYADVFRRSPFVATMPVEDFPSVDYHELMLDRNFAHLISRGVIVTGVPFQYSLEFKTGNFNSYLVNDVVSITKSGPVINKIHFIIGFNDGPQVEAEYADILDKKYNIAIKTPTNIDLIREYGRCLVSYSNADRNALYIKDHALVYTRP